MKRKSISSLKKKADKIFSRYVRERDKHRGCITCGKILSPSKMDAGHWMGRGAGAVRYDEHNVHSQCKNCNRFSRGGQVPEIYRRKLNQLYGKEEVERIYVASKKAHRFTRDELEGIIQEYTDKLSALASDSA